MLVLYNLFIALSHFAIALAASWNSKAKMWIGGRKNLFEQLGASLPRQEKIIWMHCASAGELEQGKPVIETLKTVYPTYKVLVTFFSPSGYAAGKKYKGVDYIFYLPVDTKKNAARFVQMVQPQLVLFVKYDFWYHHLKAIADQHIPLLLISSIFRKKQVFFKWYGNFYRKILGLFTWLFVQDETSQALLDSINVTHCSVGGDTRFDRVATIASTATDVEHIREFAGPSKLIVAGSTWPDDEQLLVPLLQILKDEYKLIIAPHEINKSHIEKIRSFFPSAVLYSQLNQPAESRVLIIDNMGLLSRLYQYATITYIGGGFNKSGIHNTLEAAVWGKPVIFGPYYQKFKEARELIQNKAAFSITNAQDLINVLTALFTYEEQLQQSSAAAADYVQQNKGATQRIVQYIQENRLLTMA